MSAIDHAALAAHGVTVIKSNQAPSGAYIASPNFPVYRFSWLRDGAFIAEAMSRLGEIESAEAFFGWCARVVGRQATQIEDLIGRHRRGEAIAPADFLPARYDVDGRPTGEAWADFQLDGYGTWLWALASHLRRHGRPVDPFLASVRSSARYIGEFWAQSCFDWWEEQPDQRHASTLGAIAAGLRAASAWPADGAAEGVQFMRTAGEIESALRRDAQRAGFIAKWLGSDAADASTIAIATPFDVLPPTDALVEATLARVTRDLVSPGGGVHRYRRDTYYGGGEWLPLAGFLGWHHARTGRAAAARRELDWIATCATGGDLPEQVPHDLLAPADFDVWVQRWGSSCLPPTVVARDAHHPGRRARADRG